MTNSIYKEAVRASFNNYVMVNQTLVKHFKDANPALLLGYLIQEECFLESQDKLDQYGYFYCKTQKLEDKYGFSYKVQDRILDSLVENQLVQVVVKRMAAKFQGSLRAQIRPANSNHDQHLALPLYPFGSGFDALVFGTVVLERQIQPA